MTPTAAVYGRLVADCARAGDRYHWLADPELGALGEPLEELGATAQQVAGRVRDGAGADPAGRRGPRRDGRPGSPPWSAASGARPRARRPPGSTGSPNCGGRTATWRRSPRCGTPTPERIAELSAGGRGRPGVGRPAGRLLPRPRGRLRRLPRGARPPSPRTPTRWTPVARRLGGRRPADGDHRGAGDRHGRRRRARHRATPPSARRSWSGSPRCWAARTGPAPPSTPAAGSCCPRRAGPSSPPSSRCSGRPSPGRSPPPTPPRPATSSWRGCCSSWRTWSRGSLSPTTSSAGSAERRTEVHEAFSARKQTLQDARARRAERLAESARPGAGDRHPAAGRAGGPGRRPHVLRLRPDGRQGPRAPPTSCASSATRCAPRSSTGRLKAARQEAGRALRDRGELYADGGAVIRLGRHRFAVNSRPFDLTLVPHGDRLAFALTGTDYRAPVTDPEFAATRPYWDRLLPSESPGRLPRRAPGRPAAGRARRRRPGGRAGPRRARPGGGSGGVRRGPPAGRPRRGRPRDPDRPAAAARRGGPAALRARRTRGSAAVLGARGRRGPACLLDAAGRVAGAGPRHLRARPPPSPCSRRSGRP